MSSNNNSSDKSSVKVIFDNDNLGNSIKKRINITKDSKHSIKLVSEMNGYEMGIIIVFL